MTIPYLDGNILWLYLQNGNSIPTKFTEIIISDYKMEFNFQEYKISIYDELRFY